MAKNKKAVSSKSKEEKKNNKYDEIFKLGEDLSFEDALNKIVSAKPKNKE